MFLPKSPEGPESLELHLYKLPIQEKPGLIQDLFV